MLYKRIKENINKGKKTKYNLAEVLLIMIVTTVFSTTITIVVSYSLNKKQDKITTKSDIQDFIEAYTTIKNEYYKDTDKNELIDNAIDGMISGLDDKYSTIYTKDEYNEQEQLLSGEYEGIGIEIYISNDNKIIINKVYENSSADKAGLKKNDIIRSINGKNIEDKTVDEVKKIIQEFKNKEINILVLRNNKEVKCTLKISKVEIPSVSLEIIENKKRKVAYIKINVFAKNTDEQFKKIYEDIKKDNIDGIILDLRDNTGGYMMSCSKILEMYIEKNQIMYKLETKEKVEDIKNTKKPIINKKTVVLVNGQTASAAEVLVASLKENLNINVVGIKTYGKGKVQSTRKLKNGSTIKYTIESWLTPKGNKIDEKGIEPTIEEKASKEYLNNPTAENDNQLQKAIELVIKN